MTYMRPRRATQRGHVRNFQVTFTFLPEPAPRQPSCGKWGNPARRAHSGGQEGRGVSSPHTPHTE